MRPRLVIIASLLFIQLVSFASARNAPDTSKKKTPFTLRSEKLRSRLAPDKILLGTTPKRSPPGAFCTRNIAPSATVVKPKAEREAPVFSSRMSRPPNQAQFSGF
jgi:hypothetical protein